MKNKFVKLVAGGVAVGGVVSQASAAAVTNVAGLTTAVNETFDLAWLVVGGAVALALIGIGIRITKKMFGKA